MGSGMSFFFFVLVRSLPRRPYSRAVSSLGGQVSENKLGRADA